MEIFLIIVLSVVLLISLIQIFQRSKSVGKPAEYQYKKPGNYLDEINKMVSASRESYVEENVSQKGSNISVSVTKRVAASTKKANKLQYADELNRGYRHADIQRWKTMDSILGYEIKRSNNLDHKCELCSKLVGKYPKSFDWRGWHDGCKCFASPIMMSREEFNRDELAELQAAFNGTAYIKRESDELVRFLPKTFIQWYAQSIDNLTKANTIPDFVTNNRALINSSLNHYN